jgi:hypothetical protein
MGQARKRCPVCNGRGIVVAGKRRIDNVIYNPHAPPVFCVACDGTGLKPVPETHP